MRLTIITCNYFKKYVQREMAKATGVSVFKPFQGWREIRKKKWYYDENRPWTDAAKAANAPMKFHKPYFIEPISDEHWSIFKGDRAHPNEISPLSQLSTLLKDSKYQAFSMAKTPPWMMQVLGILLDSTDARKRKTDTVIFKQHLQIMGKYPSFECILI